jgi:hypothetical protein
MSEDFLKLNPHYIVTYHLSDLTRDLSGNNPENIPPLENGEYQLFMINVNNAVRMGPLVISIYTDPSGIGIALDTNGNPILNRTVSSTNYIYPYFDFSGNIIDGVLTCIFEDGSSFSNNDENNTAYWYNIEGVTDPNNLQQYT